jgi:8-oxo-dGTP diphosphatase
VHVDLSSYAARLTDAVPTSSTDHDSLRWLYPDELRALTWAKPDLPVVALLAQGEWANQASCLTTERRP